MAGAESGDMPLDTLPVTSTRGEQSNSSLIFGERAILKMFRRLDPGPNPDVEIGLQLSERVGFPRVPAVLGALHYLPAEGEGTTLAVAHRLVAHQANGWEHAIGELDRFFDRIVGATGQVPPSAEGSATTIAAADIPSPARDAMGTYMQTAGKLGQRTAEMHLALAAEAGNAAFAPEPFVTRDLALIAAKVADDSRPTLAALERHLAALPADAQGYARTVLERRDELTDRLLSLTGAHDFGKKIRIHGDYHLGQVLWAETDFYILDFEGEPDRPLAERRAKQSPLKDVAGMIRSFGYAASAGLRAFALSHPMERERLLAWADLWQTWAAAAFLRSYLKTAGSGAFLPQDRASIDNLLRVFTLEKALYELRYELNHRPDWVSIPLSGIVELLGR
jgi:trehalose synthase-fused probable maltokinase